MDLIKVYCLRKIERFFFLFCCIFFSIKIGSFEVLYGDEGYYLRLSNSIKDYLFGNVGELDLVGDGFVSPGVSFLILPSQLFFEQSIYSARQFLLIINIFLINFILNKIEQKSKNYLYVKYLIILSPFYTSFLQWLWADLIAAHLIIIFLIYVYEYLEKSNYKIFTKLIILIFLTFFLRPQYIVLFIILEIILIYLVFLSKLNLKNFLRKSFFIFLISFLAIAQKQYQLNQKYPGVFMSTANYFNDLRWENGFDYNKFDLFYEKINKSNLQKIQSISKEDQSKIILQAKNWHAATLLYIDKYNLNYVQAAEKLNQEFLREDYSKPMIKDRVIRSFKKNFFFKKNVFLRSKNNNNYILYLEIFSRYFIVLIIIGCIFYFPIKNTNHIKFYYNFCLKSVLFAGTINFWYFLSGHERYHIFLFPIIYLLPLILENLKK